MTAPAKLLPKGYRPFTLEAAARIAGQFEISPHTEALFKLVTCTLESYQKFVLMPDMAQQKDALEKLSRALGKAVTVASQHKRVLADVLEGLVLQRLGELLTYQGIEKLLERQVARPVIRTFTTGDQYEAETELDRSAVAAGGGPALLIALLEDLKWNADEEIKRGRQNKGGREPKDLLRHSLIYELAKRYSWFFGKPPTSSGTGPFANFCRAVLAELQMDQAGLEKAIENVFARERRSQSPQ